MIHPRLSHYPWLIPWLSQYPWLIHDCSIHPQLIHDCPIIHDSSMTIPLSMTHLWLSLSYMTHPRLFHYSRLIHDCPIHPWLIHDFPIIHDSSMTVPFIRGRLIHPLLPHLKPPTPTCTENRVIYSWVIITLLIDYIFLFLQHTQ